MTKQEAIALVQRMAPVEMVEFFYQATRGLDTAKYPYDAGRYLLCEARRKGNGPWEMDILAPPKGDAQWIGDTPINLKGACPTCRIGLRTWDRKAACPACGATTTCS